MKCSNTATNRENRFSIGQEVESGRYYLSIPVSDRLCDHEEYYLISPTVHDAYPANLAKLIEFANECRKKLNDHLLLQRPGTDRGFG